MISRNKKPNTYTTSYLTVHLYHHFVTFSPSLIVQLPLSNMQTNNTFSPYFLLLLTPGTLSFCHGDCCLTDVSLLNSSVTLFFFLLIFHRQWNCRRTVPIEKNGGCWWRWDWNGGEGDAIWVRRSPDLNIYNWTHMMAIN